MSGKRAFLSGLPCPENGRSCRAPPLSPAGISRGTNAAIGQAGTFPRGRIFIILKKKRFLTPHRFSAHSPLPQTASRSAEKDGAKNSALPCPPSFPDVTGVKSPALGAALLKSPTLRNCRMGTGRKRKRETSVPGTALRKRRTAPPRVLRRQSKRTPRFSRSLTLRKIVLRSTRSSLATFAILPYLRMAAFSTALSISFMISL